MEGNDMTSGCELRALLREVLLSEERAIAEYRRVIAKAKAINAPTRTLIHNLNEELEHKRDITILIKSKAIKELR
jgi:hypothetical protein